MLITRRKLLRRSALAAPALIIPGRSRAAGPTAFMASTSAVAPGPPSFGAGFSVSAGLANQGSPPAVTFPTIGNPAGDLLVGMWHFHAAEDFVGPDSISIGGQPGTLIQFIQSPHATQNYVRGVMFFYFQGTPANATLSMNYTRTWTPFGTDISVFSETGQNWNNIDISGVGVSGADWSTAYVPGSNIYWNDDPTHPTTGGSGTLSFLTPQGSDPQTLNAFIPANNVGVGWINGGGHSNPTSWAAAFTRVAAAESTSTDTIQGNGASALAICTTTGNVTLAASGTSSWQGFTMCLAVPVVGGISTPRPPTASVSLTSSPNPSVHLTNVLYTATVTGTGSTPTGKVVFADMDQGQANVLGTVTLSGGMAQLNNASLSGTALGQVPGSGRHNIAAFYSGDQNYAPARTLNLQTVT